MDVKKRNGIGMKRKGIIILLTACAALISGCENPEIDEIKYTRVPNIAVPVFHSDVDYNGIFRHLAKNRPHNDAKVSFDNDGFIYLIYDKDYTISWDSVADINSIHWNTSQMYPTKKGLSITDSIRLNADPTQRFDTLVIAQATMTVRVAKQDIAGQGKISFSELTKNGKPLEIDWQIDEGVRSTIDLEGYKILPKHAPGLSYMTVNATIGGTEKSSVAISQLNMEMKMSDLLPKVIFGFFGTKYVFESPTSMELSFFRSHDFPDEVQFTGAFINLDVNNWTGTQFDLKMEDKYLVNSNRDSLPIHILQDSALFIDQIDHTNYRTDGSYEPQHNYFTIDSTNSDVNAILSSDPNNYDYRLRILSNPHGETQQNFITAETNLEAKVEMYVPFWLQINNLTRHDTIEFDINNIILDADNADYIDSIVLHFDFNNGFPLTLWSQAYLVDESYAAVDSLFDRNETMWESPEFDDNLRVSRWTETEKRTTMGSEKIRHCSERNVKKIILETGMSTIDKPNRYYKFYKEYGLTMDFSFEMFGRKK